VIISNEGLPHALRAIIVIPAAMIFAALGLDWLISKIKSLFEKQKEKYPNLNESNFKKLGKIVYKNNSATLYKINSGGF
jgi:hypothetical protein